MKPTAAEIFDQALQRLKAGASLQEVLSAYPEQQEELKALLTISQGLLVVPKKTVPEPAMQRKYIFAPARKFWFAWLHLSKIASVSVSMVLLVTAVAGTGYAASKSMPGQTLFGVKKASENLRLTLTTDPVDKANLQVEIAKKRLSEVQQVFNNPERDPKQEIAALAELSTATKNTIDAVNTVAKAAPAPQESHPIVASLDDLTNKQQALLQEIKPDTQNSSAANGILAELKDSETTIRKMVAASNGDTTLTTLSQASSTPDSQSISGTQASSTEGTVKGTATSTKPQIIFPKPTSTSTPPAQDETNVDQNSGSQVQAGFIMEPPEHQGPPAQDLYQE